MKKIRITKKHVYIILLSLVLLSFLTYVIIINIYARKFEKYTEITFVTPNQALVFWKTPNETLGYIKYGKSRFKMKEIALQTSSEESQIHVVFIENIPMDGIYIKKMSDRRNILIFPTVENIKYIETNQANE